MRRHSSTSTCGIRVLHVVRKLNIGGLETALLDIVAGLRRREFVQAVCCLEERGSLADLLPADVPVWSCTEGRRGKWHRPEFRAAGVLKRFAPQVSHAANCGAWIDASVAWLLAGMPGRLAFTLHGWDQVQAMSRRRAMVCRTLARMTTAVTAVSEETARTFASESGIRLNRIGVLPHGIDLERFRPDSTRTDDANRVGPVVFGCVARLDPIKGHKVLLEAVKLLLDRNVAGFEVRVIGDGPMRNDLVSLASRLAVDDHVHFLGRVGDITHYYRALDVFVLPSLREGRPLTILEAMASGLPVIASRVGSVPGLLGRGEAGLLVEPGDPAQLAEAMACLIRDPELRRRQGRFARAKAEKDFSLAEMIDSYSAFYRAIADGCYRPGLYHDTAR